MSRPNKFLFAAASTLMLTACQTTDSSYDLDHFGHSDRMAINSGEAIAANRVAQMVDPWPVAARDRNFSTSGKRMQKAMDKYNAGPATATSSSSASAAAPAASAESGSETKN